MSDVNPHWQNGFDREVHFDHITGKWWFELNVESETMSFSFESQVVYSSQEDAENAADDAAAASDYQARCVGVDIE